VTRELKDNARQLPLLILANWEIIKIIDQNCTHWSWLIVFTFAIVGNSFVRLLTSQKKAS